MVENLFKSRSNKIIAGVCGGIGEYFKVDATLIRLVWALTFFMGGAGFILYILAAIIVPERPYYKEKNNNSAGCNRVETVVEKEQTYEGEVCEERTCDEYTGENRTCEGQTSEGEEQTYKEKFQQESAKTINCEEKRRRILGFILVILGSYFLLWRFLPFLNLDHWWPVILIILGIVLLIKK